MFQQRDDGMNQDCYVSRGKWFDLRDGQEEKVIRIGEELDMRSGNGEVFDFFVDSFMICVIG